MKKNTIFNLSGLPHDIITEIYELCVHNKMIKCTKKDTLQMVILSMVSKQLRCVLEQICLHWTNKIKLSRHIAGKHNFFTYAHVMTNSCVICKKSCRSFPTANRLFLFCHDKCLDTITETTYYFDHTRLHRNTFQNRLPLVLKAIIYYFKLTPKILESILPTIFRTGLNHDYRKVCLRCDERILEPQKTLFGYYSISDSLLNVIIQEYESWYASLKKPIVTKWRC